MTTGAPAGPAERAAPSRDQGVGTPAPTSTRDRKKLESRLRIHTAAVRLAVERGLHDVTVEEIAVHAGVSPRTFFNYFATKEDAVVGSDPDRPDRLRRAVLARPDGESVVVAIRTVLTDSVRALESDPELWRMRAELAAANPGLAARIAGAGDRLEAALVEAAYERTGADPATDLAPGLTARVAMAAVRAAFHQHRVAGLSGPLADRLDAAFAAVGLGPGD